MPVTAFIIQNRLRWELLCPCSAQLIVSLLCSIDLQHKLCAGANRLSGCLLPTPTADGLAYSDLSLSSLQHTQQQQQQRSATPPIGSSSSSSKVWQFGFSLLKATHVGPNGFESQRQPLYRVARVCIFDKANNRFLGRWQVQLRQQLIQWCKSCFSNQANCSSAAASC
jgi:hypothetical protein